MILLLIGLVFALVYAITFIIWIIEVVKSLTAVIKGREYSSRIIWYIPIWVMIISALGLTITEILRGMMWLIYLIISIFWFALYLIIHHSYNKK